MTEAPHMVRTMERWFDAAMGWLFVTVVPYPPLTPMPIWLWFVDRAGRWAYKDYGR